MKKEIQEVLETDVSNPLLFMYVASNNSHRLSEQKDAKRISN